MRRISWLAIALLAGLLVVMLPLASAEPAPASAYLQLVPIVGRPHPLLATLVLRDADLSADRRGYTVVHEGALTNDAAAAAFADPAAALAQFAVQGRLGGYELVAERFPGYPYRYYSRVTRYANVEGAAAGLDMAIDAAAPPEPGGVCGPWNPYVSVERYGGEQARAKDRVCTSGRVGHTDVFVAVRRGVYVATVEIPGVSRADEVTLKALLEPAVAKLP
jgi:hypothetical protein